VSAAIFGLSRGSRQPATGERCKNFEQNVRAASPRPRRFIGGRPGLRRHGKGDHPIAFQWWWHRHCKCGATSACVSPAARHRSCGWQRLKLAVLITFHLCAGRRPSRTAVASSRHGAASQKRSIGRALTYSASAGPGQARGKLSAAIPL
jgi:hypothetical protein